MIYNTEVDLRDMQRKFINKEDELKDLCNLIEKKRKEIQSLNN